MRDRTDMNVSDDTDAMFPVGTRVRVYDPDSPEYHEKLGTVTQPPSGPANAIVVEVDGTMGSRLWFSPAELQPITDPV